MMMTTALFIFIVGGCPQLGHHLAYLETSPPQASHFKRTAFAMWAAPFGRQCTKRPEAHHPTPPTPNRTVAGPVHTRDLNSLTRETFLALSQPWVFLMPAGISKEWVVAGASAVLAPGASARFGRAR